MEEFTTKQVSKDDLNKIEAIEKMYQEITIELGQLQIDKIITEQHLADIAAAEVRLKEKYIANQVKENELATYLNNTYGEGTLDLETGVFKATKAPTK